MPFPDPTQRGCKSSKCSLIAQLLYVLGRTVRCHSGGKDNNQAAEGDVRQTLVARNSCKLKSARLYAFGEAVE